MTLPEDVAALGRRLGSLKDELSQKQTSNQSLTRQALDAALGHIRTHRDVVVGLAAPSHVARLGTLFFDDTNNIFYVNNSGAASWTAIGGGTAGNHTILDGSVHTDSVADGVTRGSIIIGNADPKWDELVAGAAATLLQIDAADGDPAWVAVSGDATIAAGGAVTVAGTHAGSAHHTQNTDTKIINAAGDTKVDVEEGADDDIVRMDVGGFANVFLITAGDDLLTLARTWNDQSNSQIGKGLVVGATGTGTGDTRRVIGIAGSATWNGSSKPTLVSGLDFSSVMAGTVGATAWYGARLGLVSTTGSNSVDAAFGLEILNTMIAGTITLDQFTGVHVPDFSARGTDGNSDIFGFRADAFDASTTPNRYPFWYGDVGVANGLWWVDEAGRCHFREASAAGSVDTAGVGQSWVRDDTPNARYFTDDAGNDVLVAKLNSDIKYFVIQVFPTGTTQTTGDKKNLVHIPPGLNAYELVYVHAEQTTAGTVSALLTLDIVKNDVATSMLSTLLTCDVGETGSDTATTPAVINTNGNEDVLTNDVVFVNVDVVHGTAGVGLLVTLGFKPK